MKSRTAFPPPVSQTRQTQPGPARAPRCLPSGARATDVSSKFHFARPVSPAPTVVRRSSLPVEASQRNTLPPRSAEITSRPPGEKHTALTPCRW